MTEWNGFKGAARRIDDIDIPRIGHKIGVGEDELHAFMDVEAAGSGFDSKGRPKMLFEPHVFYRNLTGAKRKKAVDAGLAYPKWKSGGYPKDSYPRLIKAMVIDETAALKAASWGLGQILGENHTMIGYATPQAMVRAFMVDEEDHLEAIVNFLIASGIDDDLKAHRWEVVARIYNGPGYKKHNYHGRMAKAFAKWKKIKDTPWAPPGKTPLPAFPRPLPPTGDDFDELEGPTPEPEYTKAQIEGFQRSLIGHGYVVVGGVDGKVGDMTKSAIRDFRANNGLPEGEHIDEALIEMLKNPNAVRPVIAPERADATESDLRAAGSEIVRGADVTKAGSIAIGGTTVAAKAIDFLGDTGGQVEDVAEKLSPFQSFLQAFSDYYWIPIVIIVLIVLFYAFKIGWARLRDHRSGNTAIVNLPKAETG